MNYMGIDHHKQYSHMTLMDEKGKILKAGKVMNFRSEKEKGVASQHLTFGNVITSP